MTFDHPWVLLGLAVFIPIIAVDLFSARQKRIRHILKKTLRTRLFASRLFFRLFLACLIVALAGPRWGIGQTQDNYHRAVDAVIALDVSRSMELGDGSPAGGVSRMERGLSIVRQAVADLPGMRFGVSISRNRGILAIPLTWENGITLDFLESMDGSAVTGRGTNLEALLDVSSGAFQASHNAARVIILVSDGEELSGSLRAALGRRSREHIAVASVAVGSEEGMPVPGEDGIISKRDSNAMRTAAAETNGIFIDGNDNNAATLLTDYLRSLTGSTFFVNDSGNSRSEQKAQWLLFAILAMAAFVLSKLSLLQFRSEKK
jgi:Ca-activated chloride channel family protein